MLTRPTIRPDTAIKPDFLKSLASEALPRDKTQSNRLHEPTSRMTSADPLTGEDFESVRDLPFLVDGNLTIYFATQASLKNYQEMPLNHPYAHLPFPAATDDDRGG